MELPFKYIVLKMIKILDEREMPLVISKSVLANFIEEIFKKGYFSIEEKKDMSSNFDFDYEMDDLFNEYYKYFDIDSNNITFDSDYIEELDELIANIISEEDIVLIHDIDFCIECNTIFLDILGIRIRKDLYDCLIQIEKEIEKCYTLLYKNRVNKNLIYDDKDIINKLRRLYLKRRVFLFNIESMVPYNERCDLANYADNVVEKMVEMENINLLLEDDQFDEGDVLYDVFLKSIFTGNSFYHSTLREKVNIDVTGVNNNIKYSKINFYLTFLKLLDNEISLSSALVHMELVKVKYRVMNALDSSFDMTLFLNSDYVIKDGYKEEYYFYQDAVYYFIKEILMYSDEMYKNSDFNVKNEMLYVTNILKRLIVETYYNLTKDREVINLIKGNSFYGINRISSGILDKMLYKPKTKIKDK